MAWIAAWLTNSTPWSSSSAVDIARPTISAICQPPEPSQWRDQVADEHTDGHADGHLGDAAQPLAVGGAEADHGGDRREERLSGARRRRSPPIQATPAAIAHWPTCHALERSRARRWRSEVRLRVDRELEVRRRRGAVARQVLAGATSRVWSTAVEHRDDLGELVVGLRGAA